MSILNMKSSLATRKFDRIFNGRPSTCLNTDNFGESPLKSSPCITKEVRWKVDKSIRKRLDKFGERSDEQLRLLQSTGLSEHKLLLDDETLHELRAHYLDQMEQCAREANWRESEPSQNDLEKYLGPVLQQIERLRSLLLRNNSESSLPGLHGVGGDEENVFQNGIYTIGPAELVFTNSNLQSQYRHELDPDWQFWFWRSDQRYLKWDFGLQKLGKSFQTSNELHHVMRQLIDIHEVGKCAID